MKPDLGAYFARIGYAGDARPDLATLRELHLLHPQAIAFENLSPLLAEPVPLGLEALQAKLLHTQRGGWCFEHNLLLQSVLRELGFAVTGLAARVLWMQSPDAVSPRSHMLLRVDIGSDSYIADVGFGGLSLTAPLRLIADLEQPTPHGSFRLEQTADGYSLWAQLPQGWRVLYRFDLQAQSAADYEYANWYLTTHPSSIFVNALMAARPAPEGRHALRDAAYSLHRADGAIEQRQLGSVRELRAVLRDRFLIELPESAQSDARLALLLKN